MAHLDFAEEFGRIYSGAFKSDEEVRKDSSSYSQSGLSHTYYGTAVSGSQTYWAVWKIIRESFQNGKLTRVQYQTDIAWDNRTQGWPA